MCEAVHDCFCIPSFIYCSFVILSWPIRFNMVELELLFVDFFHML